MSSPRILIVRAPGTNCDEETAHAFKRAGGEPIVEHVNRIIEDPGCLTQYQILCFPGGFSYGDDVAAGRILASQLRHQLMDVLFEFRESEKLILGICNGFQILLKTGLLLADDPQRRASATLDWNDSGRFEDRWVHLRVASQRCIFLKNIESMYLPVAHAEGKFVTRDNDALGRLDSAGQLVLRYTTQDRLDAPVHYPANPNGSLVNTAGICDATGQVFGLMPHPERHIDPTHHPQWTRQQLGEVGDGLQVFKNAVEFFA